MIVRQWSKEDMGIDEDYFVSVPPVPIDEGLSNDPGATFLDT